MSAKISLAEVHPIESGDTDFKDGDDGSESTLTDIHISAAYNGFMLEFVFDTGESDRYICEDINDVLEQIGTFCGAKK